STIHLEADIQKNPSANHKLKCVLRLVSGIRFPQSGPDREDLKTKALHAGIKRINDFFDGVGTDGKVIPQKETSKQLNILLKKAQI
ncbi:MAG TPA: hypothetical protein VK465_03820, partial [Fibrobacteria bacterium]|nr:hypothetical protein [Fibrobacteria bacterium]